MDDLQQLLSKADAAAPPVQPDLANAVRRVVARRRRTRRVIGASAVSLFVIGVVSLRLVPQAPAARKTIAVIAIDVPRLRAEIAELDAQATLHEHTAAEMQKAFSRTKRLAIARRTLQNPDAMIQLDELRQAAAQLMLLHAEQLALDPNHRADATASYRTLVSLFPNTLAGREANLRLNAGA